MPNSKYLGGGTAPVPGLGKQIGKGIQASGHYEPSLMAVKIPRCTKCLSANRNRLDLCEVCGADMPPDVDHRSMGAQLGGALYPWHARFCLWLASKFTNLANRLEGD